jgi:predicted PurR-regulated permease PerM
MQFPPLAMAERDTNWQAVPLFLLLLAALVLCALILYPFLPSLTGAVVLAVTTRRPYLWLRAKIRNRTLSAAAALILVLSSIIIPLQFLVQYLLRNTFKWIEFLRHGRAQRGLDVLLDRFPAINTAVERAADVMTLSDAVQKFAGFASGHLAGVLSNSLAAITQLVIMLFLLFFLYLDGEIAAAFFASLLPLDRSETKAFVTRLEETILATVLGRLVVAATQGVIAGLAFALLGVRAAVVLGLLSAMLGLVPPFGAYLVWLPVAIWFAATGHWVKMAILLAVGTLVISTVDNFLYPALVGSQLRQHPASVFLSLLGGVWLFGIAGLVLGPLTFSAAGSLLDIWRARHPAPA